MFKGVFRPRTDGEVWNRENYIRSFVIRGLSLSAVMVKSIILDNIRQMGSRNVARFLLRKLKIEVLFGKPLLLWRMVI